LSLERTLIICHYPLPKVLRGIGPTHILSDRLYMACVINPNNQGGGGEEGVDPTQPPKSTPATCNIEGLVISYIGSYVKPTVATFLILAKTLKIKKNIT